jgi:hypothetical protein
MAGEAKTNAFMLASATVMIGPVASLYSLNPAIHSIGLVKNFSITASPAWTTLSQGVKNEEVYSVMTGNPVQATMEVFEFTGKNMSYGLGLDGSTLSAITTSDVTTTAVVGDGIVATFVMAALTDNSAGYPTGGYLYVQGAGGTDVVYIGKIVSATYAAGPHTTTVVVAAPVPTGMTFAIGSKISAVNRIDVGSTASQPYFSAKIVAILPENNEPLTILLPKIRIAKGFTVAFQSGTFGNLPYEFKAMDVVPSDPFYADFVGRGPGAMFGRM